MKNGIIYLISLSFIFFALSCNANKEKQLEGTTPVEEVGVSNAMGAKKYQYEPVSSKDFINIDTDAYLTYSLYGLEGKGEIILITDEPSWFEGGDYDQYIFNNGAVMVTIKDYSRDAMKGKRVVPLSQLNIKKGDIVRLINDSETQYKLYVETPVFKKEGVKDETPQKISDIPETKFDISNSTESELIKYKKGPKLTQKERESLKIDNIGGDVLNKYLKNKELVKGKVIYQAQNGHIETLVHVFEENGSYQFTEFIISYDTSGNYIDHLMVGQSPFYVLHEISAVLKGDNIKVRTHTEEDMDYPATTTYSTYKISPELKFTKID